MWFASLHRWKDSKAGKSKHEIDFELRDIRLIFIQRMEHKALLNIVNTIVLHSNLFRIRV